MAILLLPLCGGYQLTSPCLHVCCRIRERIREDIEVFPIPLHKHSHLLSFKFPHIEKLIGYIAVGISQIYVSRRNVCTRLENVMYSLWLWIGDMEWGHVCSMDWGYGVGTCM